MTSLRRTIFFGTLALAFVCANSPILMAQDNNTAPAEAEGERVYSRDEVSKPAVIITIPDPVYHKIGGKLLDVSGAVKVSVILGSSGRVTSVEIFEGLSKAQNFAAIKAARRITFMPATKDGRPVSQSYVAEYKFQVVTNENGSTDELKDLVKFFVDAGGDREAQREIVGEILRQLPQLELVDRPEQAECILIFSSDKRIIVPAGNAPQKMTFGKGWVVRPLSPERRRMLMFYQGDKSSFVEKEPSTTFAQAFVYEYKRANNPRK